MREALSGLTLRGRAFLAAGISAVVCAILLGQSTLVRVGVLLVALPLVTAFAVGRARYKLSLVRTVSPQVVPAGQSARVRLTLRNDGRMPTGALRIEEQVPYALGSRPRFVVEGVEHGWHGSVDYPVRAETRGRYELGPMTVRVGDPFGLVELTRAFRTTTPLVVTPHTVPLPGIALSGSLTGSGDQRPRAFAGGSAEDVTVRDYRRGDDLRRVHWRSSAKVGELMVRREEQPWQTRATVFLDNRVGAHRGEGAASSLETAVVVAASVAAHLTSRGYTVRLVTAAGEDPGTSWQHDDAAVTAGHLLEALAMVQALPNTVLETGWLREQGAGSLTVAVVGGLTGPDLAVMRRVQHHAGGALAVALDVDAWGPTRIAGGGSAGWLLQQGWRAVGLTPDDRIDQAWQELGAVRAWRRGVAHAHP
ncbi:Uncharacterized conserved protein, DUF58 family, contains vWF domain [Nocardioides terrae]|uniref:Uncharacterized conserved protein, DUF58 family, contains vWF domain n=1 Tax=Nocardioides terrae TaxID=574651 RepID=A0A1I1G0B3_9ACTN|nr:DUF58 domain-containing protein [Nocardioides terrae]SFC04975.1 Uncharacterized conserved protein, DUF58 family, contains vWF domain [Nocardioides terrae]